MVASLTRFACRAFRCIGLIEAPAAGLRQGMSKYDVGKLLGVYPMLDSGSEGEFQQISYVLPKRGTLRCVFHRYENRLLAWAFFVSA